MAVFYVCPKCGCSSDAHEWNDMTRREVTGDPNGDIVSITDTGDMDCFHICPACHYQSARSEIKEKSNKPEKTVIVKLLVVMEFSTDVDDSSCSYLSELIEESIAKNVDYLTSMEVYPVEE